MFVFHKRSIHEIQQQQISLIIDLPLILPSAAARLFYGQQLQCDVDQARDLLKHKPSYKFFMTGFYINQHEICQASFLPRGVSHVALCC
jgi:hypothetical protein